MTDPTPVERLAEHLCAAHTGGHFQGGGCDDPAGWVGIARVVLAELGLVAVDPTQIAAVRDADRALGEASGPSEEWVCAINAMREKAKLADAILAQLEPPR